VTLILEGANFTGKSTVVERWKDQIPVFRALRGLPEYVIDAYGLDSVLIPDLHAADFIRQTGIQCIFERSCLSAHFYNNYHISHFTEWLKLLPDPEVIILYCDSTTLIERMEGQSSHLRKRMIDENKVLELNEAYSNLCFDIGTKVHFVNTSKADSSDKIDDIIIKHFKETGVISDDKSNLHSNS
jgi:hypothetical protein